MKVHELAATKTTWAKKSSFLAKNLFCQRENCIMLVQKYGGISKDFSKNEIFQALKVLDTDREWSNIESSGHCSFFRHMRNFICFLGEPSPTTMSKKMRLLQTAQDPRTSRWRTLSKKLAQNGQLNMTGALDSGLMALSGLLWTRKETASGHWRWLLPTEAAVHHQSSPFFIWTVDFSEQCRRSQQKTKRRNSVNLTHYWLNYLALVTKQMTSETLCKN